MYHNFFIYSSVDGRWGCFHVLAIVNSATSSLYIYQMEMHSIPLILTGNLHLQLCWMQKALHFTSALKRLNPWGRAWGGGSHRGRTSAVCSPASPLGLRARSSPAPSRTDCQDPRLPAFLLLGLSWRMVSAHRDVGGEGETREVGVPHFSSLLYIQ